jgi:hypothetical protein
VRDSFSDGFFTRMARDTHPVDLMCLYLLHGSAGQVPGLLPDQETVSFGHLSQHRGVDRWTSADTDQFSLWIRREVRGRLYGLEFRFYFTAGEPWADAVIPHGAAVGLARFMHHFRGHYASGGAPGDWDFGVYTAEGGLNEGVVLFGNHREVFFEVGRGWAATCRLHGNQLGANPYLHAGGGTFPGRYARAGGTPDWPPAWRRQVARLYGPLPLRPGRPARPEFGIRTRRRPAR